LRLNDSAISRLKDQEFFCYNANDEGCNSAQKLFMLVFRAVKKKHGGKPLSDAREADPNPLCEVSREKHSAESQPRFFVTFT
jgi:hypothetical protein